LRLRVKKDKIKERQEAAERIELLQREFLEDVRIKRLKMIQDAKEEEDKKEAGDKKKQNEKKKYERMKDSNEEMHRKKKVTGKKVTEETTRIADDKDKTIATDNSITMSCKKMDDNTSNVTENTSNDTKKNSRKKEKTKKTTLENLIPSQIVGQLRTE